MIVDVIIPARNEEQNIAALLDALPRAMLRHVVIVDNGSTDGTAALAAAGGAMVVSEPSRGYGAACLAGLAWIGHSTGTPPDAVAFVDADLSDDPDLLPRLWEPIARGEMDLMIASRPRLADPGALTWPQRVGNALSCRLIRWLTGARYTDLGPMRVIRWSCLESLAMRDRTWGWTVEMQYKAGSMKLRVGEMDVPYRRRRAGVSKISGNLWGSIKAGWKIIATIAQLRLRGW